MINLKLQFIAPVTYVVIVSVLYLATFWFTKTLYVTVAF